MSTIIRYLNPHTGQPATEADRMAGHAHYVECDHQGVPLRDKANLCRAYGSPDDLSPEEKHAVWRDSDPHVTQTQAPAAAETAAIRAELAKRYPGV
ncbi:hypothetical protein ACOCG7_24820 [Paraburkholderia sp. DD10]|jgi:hypothetical protein|uniref:hypothetical protein n=1 Tax=Paraburkholderia TaxID=1822464 RepID=UPI003A059044